MQRSVTRVLVLFTCGLIAAIVCFGLLESTASLSGAWELGGAFAGLIVTILVLDRVWAQESSFSERVKATGAEILYEDVVKVLDLRDAPPDAAPQVALLSNYYLLERTKHDRDFYMHFATTGQLTWLGSPTHPHSADWTPEDEEVTTDKERFPKRFSLRIGLTGAPVDEAIPVLAEVRYTDAFTGAAQESLETHIDEATGHLTMVVMMPAQWRADSARVQLFSESRQHTAQLPDPQLFQDGAVVMLGIPRPPVHSRLVLSWTWSGR